MEALFKEHNKANANFPVRRPDFKFSLKANDKFWYDGDPAITHLFNSLQAFFPDLEMLMINAVRASSSQITDPQLLKDISAFIGQEAQHAAKHREYNAHHAEQTKNDALVKLERFYADVHVWAENHLNDRQRLALTLAFEHFTALVAPVLMQREDIISDMQTKSPDFVWVAMWHAIEECEHKAVAFDAYMATGGGYTARAAAVLAMTALGLSMVFGGQFYLMKVDGQLSNWRSWARFAKFSFGRKGIVFQIFKRYPDWFKPGFHPNDHDTSALEAMWKERLGIKTSSAALAN